MSSRPAAPRVAILGAGPIGLEAALHAADAGCDVHVYERSAVGGNVLDWGHVRLFSPWSMNRSALGERSLAARGVALADAGGCPTGRELVREYLRPLAALPALAGRVHEGQRVLGVGRRGLGKTDLVGGPRERHPFHILLDCRRGEHSVSADVVLDCSGTYGNPNWMGRGNLPALGERALRERIDYRLLDVAGSERARLVGRRVLLIGAGHSAATALEALLDVERTRVEWVIRGAGDAPLPVVDDDPLRERARISRLANTLARGADPRVRPHAPAEVVRLAPHGEGFEVELDCAGARRALEVDRILAHVGWQPDNALYRELQVHECYASLAPMRLAATLLSGSGDCLSQPAAAAELLRNPEPDFFILGAKSYGKNPDFLIRTGHAQIREVLSLIVERADERPQAGASAGGGEEG